jgi:cobalt-zinc-cadmium efflux system outer membrane protein
MRLARQIVICLLCGLSGLGLAVSAEPVELASLVEIALDENRSLDALDDQIAALESKLTRAGVWQDPSLTVAYQNVPVNSFALGETPMSMLLVRVDQSLPFAGKTSKREAVVREESQAKHWELDEQRSRLRALIKEMYYKLALARQLGVLTTEHLSLVDQFVDVVRVKYEVGRAAQYELLRLEVLRERLVDDRDKFEQQDDELTAVLNVMLHRDVSSPIETPEQLMLDAPTHSLAELRQLALTQRPLLKQFESIARMHDATADLAQAEVRPDPRLFASYGFREALDSGEQGEDLVTLGIALRLPFHRDARQGTQVRQSQSLARAALAGREAQADTQSVDLARALSGWERAVDRIASYSERIIPAAERALDATFSSYQVDRADFVSLYQAEMELLDFERMIRLATVDGLLAKVKIEQLCGEEVR